MEIEQDKAMDAQERQEQEYVKPSSEQIAEWEKQKKEELAKYILQEELKKLYKVHSEFSNEFFIKVLEGNSLFRITFCERDPDNKDLYPRSAIDLTANGILKLYQTLGGLFEALAQQQAELQKQMQEMQEAPVERNRAPE